jgi:hypothetical protein
VAAREHRKRSLSPGWVGVEREGRLLLRAWAVEAEGVGDRRLLMRALVEEVVVVAVRWTRAVECRGSEVLRLAVVGLEL